MLHYKSINQNSIMLDNGQKKRRSLPTPSKQKKLRKFSAWRIMKILVSLEILSNGDYTASEKKMNPVLDMLHMIFQRNPQAGHLIDNQSWKHIREREEKISLINTEMTVKAASEVSGVKRRILMNNNEGKKAYW